MTSGTTTISERRGFTFIEMVLGMVVTALVMAALAALMGAVGRGWMQSESTQSSASRSSQIAMRIQRVLRSAKQLGAYNVGSLDGTAAKSAAILLWKADSNYDKQVQYSECAMLSHVISGDPNDANTIRYYEVVWPDNWTTAQKAAADIVIASDDGYVSGNIDLFPGLANVTYTVLARNVTGATFRRYDSSTVVRPRFEYVINLLKGDNTTETEYGTVTVRCAAPLPVSQGGL